jgi:DNA-directed RNA polymerase subunit F
MDWQDGTGGGFQLQREAYRPTSLAYESVSGERWVEGIETAGSRSTGESRRRSIGALPRKHLLSQRRVPTKAIQRRRLCLQLCIDELERARENSDDPILRANSLAQVRDHLQTLWDLLEGDSQSEAFEEMVNVLQVAFCDENLGAITPSQSDAIRSVLVKLHDDPDVDDQAANELTQELIRGGVDVFREIG